MTLIVAIKYKTGVVMGNDKRIISGGAAPLKRDEEIKIDQISRSTAIATISLQPSRILSTPSLSIVMFYLNP